MGHDADAAAHRGAGGRAAALLRTGAVRAGRDRDRRRSPGRGADRAIEPAKDRIWRPGAWPLGDHDDAGAARRGTEEQTSELQSPMRIANAGCFSEKKKDPKTQTL